MKLYLISLSVGVLAGLLYGVLNVRSPAPPVVALIGLFGMLLGEQAVPFAKKFLFYDQNITKISRPASDDHMVNTMTKETDKTQKN